MMHTQAPAAPISAKEEKKASTSATVNVFTGEEKVATYTVEGVTKQYSYVDDCYGDAVLRCLLAEYCDDLNIAFTKSAEKETKREPKPPVIVRPYKNPGDLGFEVKATPAYKDARLAAFMLDTRKTKIANSKQKIQNDAEILAAYFMKNDRARAEFCKVPAFIPSIKKLIVANKAKFPEAYQSRIAKFEDDIDHAYAYVNGKNITRKDQGWSVELQHNFYFLLSKGGTEIFSLLRDALINDLELQAQMKRILTVDTIPIDEKESHERAVHRRITLALKLAVLKNYLVSYDQWSFLYNKTSSNWTQCLLTVVPPAIFNADHLRLFDSDQEFTRGDVRMDVSNRFHRNITSPLFTKRDGDIMGGRVLYGLQHLDDIFQGHSIPSILEESKNVAAFSSSSTTNPNPLLLATFRVVDSVRTAQSKALEGMDAVPVVRLLADDENIRKVVIAFVAGKLQQEGIRGNKEREDFYINKAIQLLAEDYRPFLAEITWKQYLQKHYHNTIIHNSTVAHYKGQAVIKTELELIKNMSGGVVPELIFMVDRSGSMVEEIKCGSETKPRINVVTDTMQEILENFAERNIQVNFKVVSFDDQAGWMQGGKSYCSTNPADVSAFGIQLAVERTSGCLRPRGSTALSVGYDAALSQVTPGCPTQIFILSDGIANDCGLAQYPKKVKDSFQKMQMRSVKVTDVSVVAFHIVPELYESARRFLDAVIEPFAKGNPTAQNVSLPVRPDLISDAVSSLCGIVIGNTYKVMGRAENGKPLMLGVINTNQPKNIYSAVMLADAAAGCTTYLDIADGTTIEVKIPAGTVVREMSLEEIKVFELRELLFEIEERHPGILFSTESKIAKENRDLFAQICVEYGEELPQGAKAIAEYYILGATPSTKAMVECGLIEVRAAVVSARKGGRISSYRFLGSSAVIEPKEDGADDMPSETDLNTFDAIMGAASAQHTCKEEKKPVAVQPREPVVKLPAELVTSAGKEEKKATPMAIELVLLDEKEIKEDSPRFIVRKILKAYEPVQDRLMAMAKERRDAAAGIVDKLRQVRDAGYEKIAALQKSLAEELKAKQASCDDILKQLLEPHQKELDEKNKQFAKEFKGKKKPIEDDIEQKQAEFKLQLSEITSAYQSKIAAKTKQIAENKDLLSLKKQLEQKVAERGAELGKESIALDKSIEKRETELKADSTIVSQVETRSALIEVLKKYPKQFDAGRKRQPDYAHSTEEVWVDCILGSSFDQDTPDLRAGFKSISGTPGLEEYEAIISIIADVRSGKKKYREADAQLSELLKKRETLQGDYNARHIVPLQTQINEIEKRDQAELAELKKALEDPKKAFENKEIVPLQEKITALENSLRADIVKPVENRITALRDIKRKAIVDPAKQAVLALKNCKATTKVDFDKYFNDVVLPAHEAALVNEENAIDQCVDDMNEIRNKLTKAAVKGFLYDREIYRVNRHAKAFDKFAKNEMQLDLQLLSQQEAFLNGITKVSAERNMLLKEVPAEDLAAEREEMRFIKNYKSADPALRIMENDDVAVIRVIKNGKIEAETWVTDLQERRDLTTGASAKVIELLLKNHRRGMKSQIEAIIAGKKLEEVPDTVVTPAMESKCEVGMVKAAPSVAPVAHAVPVDAFKAAATKLAEVDLDSLPKIALAPISSMWKPKPNPVVTLAAVRPLASDRRYKFKTFVLR